MLFCNHNTGEHKKRVKTLKNHVLTACYSEVIQTNNWSKVETALKNGQPVVSIQSTGLFTGGGHFIVLTGMTEDGKVLVNDPNGGNWRKNATMIEGFENGFTPSQIRASGGTYWIYQPKDEVLALRAEMANNN